MQKDCNAAFLDKHVVIVIMLEECTLNPCGRPPFSFLLRWRT